MIKKENAHVFHKSPGVSRLSFTLNQTNIKFF